MTTRDERWLVYAALVLVSSLMALLLGIESGIWTLLQMTAATELMYWLGSPFGDDHTQRTI
ncbi:MAG: hypothetical protein ABJK20_17320 [Halieaceae bacterium]